MNKKTIENIEFVPNKVNKNTLLQLLITDLIKQRNAAINMKDFYQAEVSRLLLLNGEVK